MQLDDRFTSNGKQVPAHPFQLWRREFVSLCEIFLNQSVTCPPYLCSICIFELPSFCCIFTPLCILSVQIVCVHIQYVCMCVLLNWINSVGYSLRVEKSLPAVTSVLQLHTHPNTHTHTLTQSSITEYSVIVEVMKGWQEEREGCWEAMMRAMLSPKVLQAKRIRWKHKWEDGRVTGPMITGLYGSEVPWVNRKWVRDG